MNILLIDDHSLFREGLELVLQRLDPAIVAMHAATLQDGLDQLKAPQPPDLVLTDLNLPGVQGMTSLLRLRETRDDIPVVVLAGSEEPSVVRKTIDLGAMGYIPKSSDSAELARALTQILRGGVYLPALALATEQRDAPMPTFTPRQQEVLLRLVQGKSNKAIARELGISDTTVKSHVTVLLQGLGAGNRAQAVYRVAQLNWNLFEPQEASC